MLTHLSLCTGIGGIDLAAERAGFTTVAQCEIDSYASRVLAKNFKGVPNLNDIRTVTAAGLRKLGIPIETDLTVISAGFPCQPYSLAGKGLGDSDERDLWGEVARVVREVRPKWFVGENTPGLFSRENQRYFRRVINDLSQMGYSVGWGMWGACDAGAPHKRNRVFIVGRYINMYGQQAQQRLSWGTNTEPDRVCGKISDTVIIRRNTDEIQRGEFAQSWKEPDKGGLQIGGCKFGGVCGSISNATSKRLGLHGSTQQAKKIARRRGYSRARAEANAAREWWQTEPDVGRVANGVPFRVDRLRCLGNAVVPAQIYPLLKAIADYGKI